MAVGDGQNDLGPFHESGLGGARASEFLDGQTLFGRQFSKCDLGLDGCSSLRVTPIIREAPRDLPDAPSTSSLPGRGSPQVLIPRRGPRADLRQPSWTDV